MHRHCIAIHMADPHLTLRSRRFERLSNGHPVFSLQSALMLPVPAQILAEKVRLMAENQQVGSRFPLPQMSFRISPPQSQGAHLNINWV